MSATAGEPRCTSLLAASHSSGTSSSPVHTVPQGDSSFAGLLGGTTWTACAPSLGSFGGVRLAIGVGLGGRLPSCEVGAALATSTGTDRAVDDPALASCLLCCLLPQPAA